MGRRSVFFCPGLCSLGFRPNLPLTALPQTGRGSPSPSPSATQPRPLEFLQTVLTPGSRSPQIDRLGLIDFRYLPLPQRP